MYQDLSERHDWPVKKAIVRLPIRLKGNSERISGNSLSPLWGGEQGSRLCFPANPGRYKPGSHDVCVQATVRVATNLQESGLGKIKETVDLDV